MVFLTVVVGVFLGGATVYCAVSCKADRWHAVPALVAGLLCYLTFANLLPVASDHERESELAEAYPQLSLIKVWNSGNSVSYYADAGQRIRCIGTVVALTGEEPSINYTHGALPACQKVLNEATSP